jgi:hypothetical protein
MQIDIERRLAIAELLAQPDPPDLRYRGHRVLLEGKAERFRLVPLLASAFVQAKLLALHERRAEAASAVSHEAPAVVHRRAPKRVLAAA